jgi:vitamin B12 transporter
MTQRKLGWLGLCLASCLAGVCSISACAQVATPAETVTVFGQLDPATQRQSQRSSVALDAQTTRLTVDGAPELLRDDASVDLQQRGGGDTQADLSIRGSSYEQTLVLLNGLRINDAQTSHFNLDLPVPFDALGGVYVLHGAGSTLYGSDAVSGVVNVTTAAPVGGWALRLRAGGGSFGGNNEAAVASWARGAFSEVAAGGRDVSEGFIADRDFRSEEASSETRLHSPLGESDVLLAGSDRAFGANDFYGEYPSWERTKGWFAAITQQVNAKTQAALSYRRHSDDFVLFRDDPALYENHHIDDSWQGVVRRRDDFRFLHTRLDYGVDINADQIASSSLGHHGRNRGAGYVSAQANVTKHAVASVGLREEIFSGGNHVLVPSFAASDFVRPWLKLRGAISRGFRLPTYTDLYYTDPADVGNPLLKPESAWSYEGGADWYPGARWLLSATGFTPQQSNVIDYVRTDASQPWRAENLTHVSITGAELSAQWQPTPRQDVRVGLTTLTGARGAANGLESKYAFTFPLENASVTWNARWKHGVTTRERLRVVHRIDGQLYPVVDSSLAYEGWRVHPYLQMTNLSNASYQEVEGVQSPPRAFAAGVEVQLGKRH